MYLFQRLIPMTQNKGTAGTVYYTADKQGAKRAGSVQYYHPENASPFYQVR